MEPCAEADALCREVVAKRYSGETYARVQARLAGASDVAAADALVTSLGLSPCSWREVSRDEACDIVRAVLASDHCSRIGAGLGR